ncbi:MAG: hypothetical protein DRG78_18325 [Epsilonproteobacteria bacterium]|nr:MAG: hypothetical protein DRG78_18325 [Campylobacterota bacterium]
MKKTFLELAKQVQSENLDMFGSMSERKIAKIIQEAFTQVKTEIENMEDDSMQIVKFGNFRVHRVERDEDGEKIMKKRIIYKPSTPQLI